jgi:UDP-GlcNAc:undecaprenyl-phosphate GlcNAc-1-phosphate transferase
MSMETEMARGAGWTHAMYWITSVSFFSSLLLTPLAREAFLWFGLVDRPDGQRKLHTSAVPRAGGIPIVLSYVIAYIAGMLLCGDAGPVRPEHLPFAFRLLPAAAIIFLTGLLDDLIGLAPYQKLAGQVAGASVAVWAGVRILSLAGHPFAEPFASLVTIAWLVGCSNAFNLIDGLDGLAAGMGLFSTFTIFVAALLQQDQALALATLPLCGSLLGFLRYNFNPASVFLGDSGSLLIGFLLGSYGVIWSQKAATALSMTTPLMALAIPLLDVVLSVARRWLRGRPIFGADRHHIHHKLLERGLTHRTVVLSLYGMCGIYAALSLMASVNHQNSGGLILVLFCAITLIGIERLGYFEFGLASRVIFGGLLRRILRGEIMLHGLRRAIERSRAPEDFWPELTNAAGQFGFTEVRARLDGRSFHWGYGEIGYTRWQVRVSMDADDFVNLTRSGGAEAEIAPVGVLIETLERGLRSRAPAGHPAKMSVLNLTARLNRDQAASSEPLR